MAVNMRFDDMTQVHYSTLKLHTTATNKYDMECTAIEATYPYLLTNLVAYFHVKFHCKQLKCSSYYTSFYFTADFGVVTWLLYIFAANSWIKLPRIQ